MATAGRSRVRSLVIAGLLLMGAMLNPVTTSVWAEDAPGRWTFGFRVGPAFQTQDLIDQIGGAETSTSVGPALNFQALYGISRYISVGLAIEWQRHSVEVENAFASADLGTLSTVSLLPTVEIRPGRYGKFMPYGTLALGMNLNSFSEEDGVSEVDMDNTLAFRIGAGTDYFLTPKLALNAELAWKMNNGDFESGGATGDFNASSMLFLLGVRYHM